MMENQLIIHVSVFHLLVNVLLVVVEVVVVVHLIMVVIDILVAEIMIHQNIVVVIHHDKMIEVMIDVVEILDHVVQFNITNVIIVQNQDQNHHHQNHVVIDHHQEIDHLNNKQLMLFADMQKVTIDLIEIDFFSGNVYTELINIILNFFFVHFSGERMFFFFLEMLL